MAYLLDANVFIEAKNSYYGMDLCPAFWDWIVRAHREGKVYSIEQVGDEIAAGDDELFEWADALEAGFFLKPDAETLPALAKVSEWVASNGYDPAAINTFLGGADYYLVAQALEGRDTVVTRETPGNSAKRVKIPNPCLGLGVKVVSPFEMLRNARARFVLDAS